MRLVPAHLCYIVMAEYGRCYAWPAVKRAMKEQKSFLRFVLDPFGITVMMFKSIMVGMLPDGWSHDDT